jgi:predicted adenylyl cyclase CyaB
MKHVNIEIKARSNNHEPIRAYLKEHGADSKGTDHQIDTYFQVSHGRLKLREGNIENALVYYERSNQKGPKQADVMLFRTEPGASLKDVLIASVGVLAVVDKQREIYFIDNVKFHLDTVKNLGTFMEIEAIDDGTRGKDELERQCQHFLQELGIKEDDLLTNSYSDMVLSEKA